MRKPKFQRRKADFCASGRRGHSSCARPPLQQLHHFQVVRVGRIVTFPYVVVLLRGLENERHVTAAAVTHEPLERLLPYVSVPYGNVAILVRSQLSLAVVQMEERRRLARDFFKLVQHRSERLLRGGDVVARGEEVA